MNGISSFLDVKGPRVFTMPSGANFLKSLAQGVNAAVDVASPYALSDTMILTPTRRAVRALGDAFVHTSGSEAAMLLPRIRAIGDVDADEPPFEPGVIALQSPPAISAEQKLFDLTALVRARLRATGQNNSLIPAMAEAEALGKLIDEAQTEEVSAFDLAREAFTERLVGQPEHVQRATRFLDIVMQYWPEHLKELGVSDPAAHRSFVLRALAQSWQHKPPSHMVIAAGSTGSVPATANLLKVISRLPFGAIILPGMDESLSDADWKEVGHSPGHPQYGLARLLRYMNITRSEVQRWPGVEENRGARLRRRLINEALLPAQATAGWGERLKRLAKTESMKPLSLVRKGLQGLSLVEAESEEEEALVLALAIRHTLSDPQKTAVLITPDRALAERVRVALWRWNISIDDSAGTPLDAAPLGVFLDLIAKAAMDPVDPVILASILNSKLACLGLDSECARTCAQKLETQYLRGVCRYNTWGDLLNIIRKKETEYNPDQPQFIQYAGVLEKAFLCFADLGNASIADWAKAHANAAQILAQGDEESGDVRLWRGRVGSAAVSILRALMDDAGALGCVDAREYWHIFSTLSRQRPIRPKGAGQARARILGPLEARMISADLVALGGLNESTWPALPAQDPFLPRPLRLELGLPDPERRLGLAAHDFAEHTSKARVLLTRSKRSGSDPAIASRWLWRLQTLIRCGAGSAKEAEAILTADVDYLALAHTLDRVPPDAVTPVLAPNPKPPLHTRPRSLYVTRVRRLIRNPYGIYAQYILNLKPLDGLGKAPGPRERGTAVHDGLEQFFLGNIAPDDPEALQSLTAHMVGALRAQGFEEYQIPAERARVKRASAWLLKWECERREQGWMPVMLEGQGALTLHSAGGAFVLKAKADRIDRGVDGYAVLDYKTGAPPSIKEVYAGFDPQLPLEAAILEGAGFSRDGITVRGTASALVYVKVSGGSEPGRETRLETKGQNAVSTEEFQSRALDQLQALILWFDNPDHAYLCQPRAKYVDSYSDYDLLARRAEWAATAEDTGAEP